MTFGESNPGASVTSRGGAQQLEAAGAKSAATKAAVKPKDPPPPLNTVMCIVGAVPLALHAAYLRSVWVSVQGRDNPFAECSIMTPLLCSFGYLGAVELGKYLMKDRKEYNVREFMFVYNVYQALLNLYMVLSFIYEVARLGRGAWGIGPPDLSSNGVSLGFIVWVHYNNKFLEYADSLFMVLRKKNNQLTFLHRYHHWLMGWAWYAVVAVAAGGDAYFGAMMNSFVHVVMYTYYAYGALGITPWWKIYVTKIQLLQFAVVATHSCYIIYRGDEQYPRWLAFFQLFVMVNMWVMFTAFYKAAYKAKKDAAAAASAAKLADKPVKKE